VLRALYARRLLDVPDQLLCPSTYVAEWFRRWGIEPGRIRALPNGIRVPACRADRAEPRGDGTLRLAILGAVVGHKGHHVLLDALAGSDTGPVTLFVHGPVGDREYLAELRERAGRTPNVRLRVCGPYDPADLTLLLADVHALVTPSVWPETFCLVIREALVRGVPVLSTRLGALREAIEPGVNGFFYDHDDPSQLGALLGRLAREPELRRRLAEGAARTRVTTLAEHAALVRDVYVEAAERRESNHGRAAAAVAELEAIERLMIAGRAAERLGAVA
jgi:glycosyltransferase involved in cell wall biosynthesis